MHDIDQRMTALATSAMRLPLSPRGGFTLFRPYLTEQGKLGLSLTGWGPESGPFAGWLGEHDAARALYESGRTL